MILKKNILNSFENISQAWTPYLFEEIENFQIKLFKAEGEFTRHKHEFHEEIFIVIEGTLMIELDDETIIINELEMIKIPKGVYHKPYSEQLAKVLIIENKDVSNTGNVNNEFTKSLKTLEI